MAETTIVPDALNINKGKYMWLKIFAWIALFFLVIFLIYWFFFRVKVNMSQVKVLIGNATKDSATAANDQKILLEGVYDIMANPLLMKQAKTFADANNIPIEQVLTDNAIAMAKEFKYIK